MTVIRTTKRLAALECIDDLAIRNDGDQDPAKAVAPIWVGLHRCLTRSRRCEPDDRTAKQANGVIQLVGDKKAIGAVVKVKGTIDQADALIRWAAWHVTAVIIPEAEIAAEHRDIHRNIKRYFEVLRRTGGLDQLNTEYAEGCKRGSMPPYRAWTWSRLAERVTAGWA